MYGNELVSQTHDGNTSYYLYDGYSGVRQLTNASGTVSDSYTYDSYGALIERTGNTTNDYLYRGEKTDSNTGLQYLRARYYDTNTGRFLSTDPFEGLQEDPISRHRYIYGNDDGVTYSDPTGLFSLTEINVRNVLLSVLEGLGTVASIQLATNLATRPIKGDITWRGNLAGLDVSLGAGLRSALLRATTLTEESTTPFGLFGRTQVFSGEWLQVSAGLDLGDLFGGLSKGGILNEPLTIRSPRVWGANPGVLSGATFSGSTSSGRFTRTALIIGLGVGLFDNIYGDSDFDAGISAYLGISIPYRANLPSA